MKKLILLILFTSFSVFTHSVKDGDMDGSWQIVEAFINGEKVENAKNNQIAAAALMKQGNKAYTIAKDRPTPSAIG